MWERGTDCKRKLVSIESLENYGSIMCCYLRVTKSLFIVGIR